MDWRFMTFGLLAAGQATLAQVPSVPSGQLQQIPPAPSIPRPAPSMPLAPPPPLTDDGPEGQRIVVNTLHVTGQTLYSEDQLVAATDFKAGSQLNLRDLRALGAKIATFYNNRGYFLTQAYLPVQDVVDGVVTIAVIEGRYGEIHVDNSADLSSGVPERILHGLESGDVVATASLERRLLLLSDIPGTRITSTLAPGSAVGTSDLIVDVAIHPDRSKAGMSPCAGIIGRNADKPVHTAFGFQPTISVVSLHADGGGLDARFLSRALIH